MPNMRGILPTLALALVLGCSSTGSTPTAGSASGDDPARASNEQERCAAPFEDAGTLKFHPDGWKTDFCKHSVPYSEIVSGGPPRDGIPPIDAPKFVAATEADAWLEGREPVIAVEIEGRARAYPLQILMWHEVVNDTVEDVPIAVTFCPLCYAAIVFIRPSINGTRLTFGTSGNLRKSDLVMWDRQTESWWQQFEGQAIVGELTGKKLEKLPASIVSWESFKKLHSKGDVLSRQTGHDRPYGKNPYAGYDDIGNKPFLYRGEIDDTLPPMARVIGLDLAGARRAYPRTTVAKAGVVNDRLGKQAITLWYRPGVASAMDDEHIADGRDIGSVGVYRAEHGGRSLTFERRGDVVRDRQTGSRWDMTGRAIAGPLAGERLQPIAVHEVFWFVWSAFAHDGDLYQPPLRK